MLKLVLKTLIKNIIILFQMVTTKLLAGISLKKSIEFQMKMSISLNIGHIIIKKATVEELNNSNFY